MIRRTTIACDFDISITLFDIDAIERIQNAFVTEVNTVFRADDAHKVSDRVGIDTTDSQIVDLTTDEHAMTLVDALVETPLMGCRSEAMTSDDGIYELFPERPRFRMTLKGMLDRKHHVARDGDFVSGKIPIGVLVVDNHESWLIRWW